MKNFFVFMVLLSLFFVVLPVLAQEETQEAQEVLTIEQVVICTSIEDRNPVGAGVVFNSNLEKLYCFTKVVGAKDTTSITHVWYFGENEVARVNLAVRSSSWRTWSSKTLGGWIGKGRVEVLSETGELLTKVEFEVQKGSESLGEAQEEEETKEVQEAPIEESTQPTTE
ncbi:MAG: DUF2914 domain-containing protein [candidate division WOR-3 bacterium]